MTGVRRTPGPSRLTFKTERRKETRKARLSNKRPGEDAGRSVPPHPGLVTYVFSGSDLKSFSVAPATAVSYGAFVAPRRRAHSEVIQRMQPDTSDEKSALDVQRQPVLWLRPERGVLN